MISVPLYFVMMAAPVLMGRTLIGNLFLAPHFSITQAVVGQITVVATHRIALDLVFCILGGRKVLLQPSAFSTFCVKGQLVHPRVPKQKYNMMEKNIDREGR